MKEKKIKKGLVLLSLLPLTLTGCSNAFFGGDTGNMISEVTTTYDSATGNTIIRISFTDEETSPVSFIVPRGLSGEDGVGIASITPTTSSDGSTITLTIRYTDATIADTVVSIPVLQGKEGNGIKETVIGKDDNGNTTIQFTYTDGTIGELITIPKANGIASLTTTTDPETGITTIVITEDNGTISQFEMKNGVDGSGILSISLNQEQTNDDYYALDITLSDGSINTINFPRPERGTKWFTGNAAPTSVTISSSLTDAKVGDFYLNVITGDVYEKESSDSWQFLFSMKGTSSGTEQEVYKVTFNPGEGRIPTSSGSFVSVLTIMVDEGKTLKLSSFPTNPVLDGYTFKGWFTDLENINAGQFTDLTVVTQDLTLTAKWELNS